MASYVVRRVARAIALLLGITVVTFVIFFMLPSRSPAVLGAGSHPSAALVRTVGRRLGVAHPFYVQYVDYLRAIVLHFDLGYSHVREAPVRTIILRRLPATLSLLLGALLLGGALGTLLGTVTAGRRGSWRDRLVTGVTRVFGAAPPYWLGLIALYLFADDVGRFALLPGTGRYAGLTHSPTQWFTALIMPWCALAATFAAGYAHLLRAGLREVLAGDAACAARLNGVPERAVILRHGLRAAIAPLLPGAGAGVAALLGGTILVEHVFAIPGLGGLLYASIGSGDVPMIQGIVLFGAGLVVVAGLIGDLLLLVVDPKQR